MMLQIKDLLKKFKSVEDPKEIRLSVVSIINQILKVDLVSEGDIEYKNNVIWIKTNPAIRHKVLVSKKECLDRLCDHLPNHTIVDIR